MNLKEKLSAIQTKLNAPKNQRNTFGKYNYRSCEDILEALKPLESETSTAVTCSDEIRQIGNRYYIMATATLYDCESDEHIAVTAWAQEAESKKGMDTAQVTGATSSYARKYALNGLFAIDDNKDPDTDNYTAAAKKAEKAAEYKCAECGKLFKPFVKNGKEYTADVVYEMAKKLNVDGVARCSECAKKH